MLWVYYRFVMTVNRSRDNICVHTEAGRAYLELVLCEVLPPLGRPDVLYVEPVFVDEGR